VSRFAQPSEDEVLVRDLVRASRRGLSVLPPWLVLAAKRCLALVLLLGAWELASGRLIRPFWVSRPSDILARLLEWALRGDLWIHLRATLLEMSVGFVLGTALGLGLGLLLGAWPLAERIVNPINVAFNALPKIAMTPVFILAFGIGLTSKIVLVVSVVVFFVLFNSITGVRQVDPDLIASVRIMGAGRLALFRKVLAPGAVAYVFAGMKIALRYALAYAVVGEIMAGNRGIGFLVESSAGNLDTTGVFAGVSLLMVCGLLLYEAVVRVEAFMLRWRV